MPPKTERQTLMFSATFPTTVQTLATDFLNDHVFITVGKVGAANQDIVQEIVQVDKYAKKDKLLEYIQADMEGGKDESEFLFTVEMDRFVRTTILDDKFTKKTMVFVERKRTADFLATFLSQAAVPATSIHG